MFFAQLRKRQDFQQLFVQFKIDGSCKAIFEECPHEPVGSYSTQLLTYFFPTKIGCNIININK